MAVEMLGTEVAKAMKIRLIAEAEALKAEGITPHLTIVRVGAREDDLAYERGAKKRMELVGIECSVVELPGDISQDEFEAEFKKVNEDPLVHGILLFRPLPKQLDEERICGLIDPAKDVDCMRKDELAKVFLGDESGYAPCTAQAVMEMLSHYGISLEGKNAVIVGRSMIVGKPLAMMMLSHHATVTICHSRTAELGEMCRKADVLVAAAGSAKMITGDMIKNGAVVADVGINVDPDGNLCGDVDYESAAEKAAFISPVPKGVGSVTTSVLAAHVIIAAKKAK